MRTTVDITDAQRTKLLELAASRGEKVPALVQEAIDLYLSMRPGSNRWERVKDALSVLGTLGDREARELAEATLAPRKSWR